MFAYKPSPLPLIALPLTLLMLALSQPAYASQACKRILDANPSPAAKLSEDEFHQGVARNLKRLIRSQPKHNRITQTQLADHLGISRSNMSFLVSGRNHLSPYYAFKIASIFKIDPMQLLDPTFARPTGQIASTLIDTSGPAQSPQNVMSDRMTSIWSTFSPEEQVSVLRRFIGFWETNYQAESNWTIALYRFISFAEFTLDSDFTYRPQHDSPSWLRQFYAELDSRKTTSPEARSLLTDLIESVLTQ